MQNAVQGLPDVPAAVIGWHHNRDPR
jgi:hypothetical protein